MAPVGILESKKGMRKDVIARRNSLAPDERLRRSVAICERLLEAFDEVFGGFFPSAEGEGGAQVPVAEGTGGAPVPARRPLVAVFSSLGSEVVLSTFEEGVLSRGARLCYPAMVRTDGSRPEMRFYEVEGKLALDKGLSFLSKPASAFEESDILSEGVVSVCVDQVDFALIPLVAFDGEGGRLGYGGGNYDAFLACLGEKVPAIGVAFSDQRVEKVPREPHDRLLPKVVSG